MPFKLARFFILCALLTQFPVFPAAAAGNADDTSGQKQIAVFVPGVVSGNAVYEMLASGVERAVAEASGVNVVVVEAGTAQSEWPSRLTALAAKGVYDVIISANPALPEICGEINKRFPNQKFLILNASDEGNKNVAAFWYNQWEQAYMAGYIAGLVTASNMPFANADKKIGLIAAQEYPDMNNILLPGYAAGARAACPDVVVDFRIVGNWYDATKAMDLARAMHSNGVDVILPISGGGNQGVLTGAAELGYYVVWFDDNGYQKLPGYVIGSAVMRQDVLAYEATKLWLEDKVEFGKTIAVGAADGYVDFIDEDPDYESAVPADLRAKMSELLSGLRSGEINLTK